MLLDTHERLRFMEYCKQQSESCRLIAKQFDEKCAHVAGDVLAKREKQKAAAYAIVALDLSSVSEAYTVSNEEVGPIDKE